MARAILRHRAAPLPEFRGPSNLRWQLRGQAAMFLSQTADEVSLLVRGPDLRKVSSYLSERILVIDFQNEMRLARANWRFNIYSDAKHRITGEGVVGDRRPEAGLHPQTDARSWQTTVEFFREVLSEEQPANDSVGL
jgi:hypothetical protein